MKQNLLIAADASSRSGARIIPLDSVMIGDGVTDEVELCRSYYPTVCTDKTGQGPIVNQTAVRQLVLLR